MDVKRMTLLELERLIEDAQVASDLFGDGDLEDAYKQLAVAVHPDKYPDAVEKETAERLFKKLATWKTLAETPERIESATQVYVLGKEIGRGDISTVRLANTSPKDVVVAKIAINSGVGKLFSKEALIIQALGRGPHPEYFPELLDNFSLPDKRKVSIFSLKPGFYPAETVKSAYPAGLDGRHLIWLFKRLLTALNSVHLAGWVHGAVLPPHLLVHPEDHGLNLIDFSLATKIGAPILAVPGACKSWYPPECSAKKPVTPATDIYLAAKTMCYMAGGDPLAETFPDTVPHRLKSYLKGCLLKSPTMRPQDALECLGEITDVAYQVYGKPKFHVLKM